MRVDNEIQVSIDRCIREFAFLATGRTILEDRAVNLGDLNLPITQSLINRLAIVGLSAVTYHARRGSLKAGTYLVDRCLGSPELPFRQRVEQMDPDEAKRQLIDEFTGSGLSVGVAESLVERLIKQEETNGAPVAQNQGRG